MTDERKGGRKKKKCMTGERREIRGERKKTNGESDQQSTIYEKNKKKHSKKRSQKKWEKERNTIKVLNVMGERRRWG